LNYSLNLSFGHTEQTLRRYLEETLNTPVSLVLTGNSTRMLSARMSGGILCVRMHRIFLNADSGVIGEIVSFLQNKRSKMPLFRGFISGNRERLANKAPKRVKIRTEGICHDLGDLYREINEKYFAHAINAAITWGTHHPRSSVRKRTLGSYSERSNMIRINPVLDRRTVPRYFVAYIVYHEMLHAVMGTPLLGNRRSIHSREFRKREKAFTEYELAAAWRKK
jgi:predicted metal-dependent hydrolase